MCFYFQKDCNFVKYNSVNKKSHCDCSIQKEETKTDITKISFDTHQFEDSFYTVLKNSNFLVMKCFKLAFSLKGQTKNIGSYFMTCIIVFFIVLTIIYILKGQQKIKYFCEQVIKNKKSNRSDTIEDNNNDKREDKKRKSTIISSKTDNKDKEKDKKRKSAMINSIIDDIKEKDEKEIKDKKRKSVMINSKIDNKDKRKDTKRKSAMINTNIDDFKERSKKRKSSAISLITGKKEKDKKNDEKEFNAPTKRRASKKINDNSGKDSTIIEMASRNILKSVELKSTDPLKKKEKEKYKEKEKGGKKELIDTKDNKENNLKKITEKEEDIDNSHTKKIKEEAKYIDARFLNDEEMNNLQYDLALLVDKRTYLQFYYSLLKKKHLILFIFLPSNDYNLVPIKCILFLISFSMYLTINGFFFSDDSMNKIYIDNGAYNFIYQLPQVLYSTIISAVINMILKYLSLSEKQILELKKEKNLKKCREKEQKIQRRLKIRIIIFLSLSTILMLFFWYFITCFCAVFPNTQSILLKDTLVSFILTMAYPFGLNLLPGIFRIPSLRAPNRDKQFLYKISKYLNLI